MKKSNKKYLGILNNEKGLVEFKDGQKLQFQNGVVGKNGVNGVQVGELIQFAIMRMEYLDELHHDRFNAKTIEALRTASDYQALRDLSRKAAKVEGTEKEWNPEY